MIARRHHYVPQCYLKGFGVPRRAGKHQVHVFDREARKVFTTATVNVAVERDFNRVEVDGFAADALENGFAKFEGELAVALERTVVAGAVQSDEDRSYILNLIGLLALRNPRWRERMRQFQERIANLIMEVALSKKERWEREVARAQKNGYLGETKVTYEEMKRFQAEKHYKVLVPTERHIQVEMHLFEAILPHLFGRRWMLLKAPSETGGFVTCDHPVSLVWSDPTKGFISPGFGSRGTEVIFTLAPRLAMVGAFEIDNGVYEADGELVAIVNGLVIGNAERQVYARDRHFHYMLDRNDNPRKASRLIDDAGFVRMESRLAKAQRDAGATTE